MIKKTITSIIKLHDGQLDKGGQPYWRHPVRVMLRLGPNAHDYVKQAALLHDVVEDCGLSVSDLLGAGYSPLTVEIVDLVTRKNGESYSAFIDRLIASKCGEAMKVKLADLYDNTAPERVAVLPSEYQWISRRYGEAIERLEELVSVQRRVGMIVGDMNDIDWSIYGN